jgi:hypothetical protein
LTSTLSCRQWCWFQERLYDGDDSDNLEVGENSKQAILVSQYIFFILHLLLDWWMEAFLCDELDSMAWKIMLMDSFESYVNIFQLGQLMQTYK